MPLSDAVVRNAKPGHNPADKKNPVRDPSKPYKAADGDGMYLLVMPDGARYWRLKYRFAGKEKLLALGVYPDTTLEGARTKRQVARALLAQGIDPSEARRTDEEDKRKKALSTFRALAADWQEKRGGKWSAAHKAAVNRRLDLDVFPKIGRRPVHLITTNELLEDVLRPIEERRAYEIAKKCRVIIGQVLRYAISCGLLTPDKDPTPALKGALQVADKQHYACLKDAELPAFLAKLEAYDGTPITKLAIRLLMLTMVRTGELREAEWSEFDIKRATWRVPAARMKGRKPHVVPLSAQALEALAQLRTLTGDGKYLFPNEQKPGKVMSENTILFALYRMGYHSRATGHGFRSTFSTIANEQRIKGGGSRWNADAIERQLAHGSKDLIRAAYARGDYMEERAEMLQWWADYLDGKREDQDKGGGKIVAIGSKRKAA